MPTWRVELNVAFDIDSDDIGAFPNFDSDMFTFGPRRQLNGERQWLEKMARVSPDHLIAYYISRKVAGNRLSLRQGPATIAEGTDGELQSSGSRFVTSSVTLDSSMVGKLVELTAVNTPPLVRGFYRIATWIDADTVELEGVVAFDGTGFTFRIWEPGEALIRLDSTDPI
ncbi:MAG: hypothetical protein ACW99J_20860 [Candidatus Thorarchaeota archaeon]|jgi:hypothetical protein